MKSELKNSILIAFICCFFLSLMFYAGFFSNIQLKLSDNLYGGGNALDSIIIVAIDDKSLQEIGRWPWNREVFASAIDKLSSAKIIGIDVAFFEQSNSLNDGLLGVAVSKANVVVPIEFTSFARENGRIVGKRMLTPIKELEDVKKGYVNIITDNDGVTRAVNMDLSDSYDNFAYVIYKEYWKKEITSHSSKFLINFVGIPESFRYVSFSDVVNGRVDSSFFDNKLVLIGSTSPDMHDDYFVPTSKGKAMPGVEIHANTIQTMINKNFLRSQSIFSVIALLFIVSILLSLLFTFVRLRYVITSLFLFIPLYLLFSIYIFNYGVIMNLIYVPLVLMMVFGSQTLYRYIYEKKEKLKIKNAFSKYVSPAVVSEVFKNPDTLKLGGTRKEITVFFSDIRGFTTISENLSPEKLVHILNEYLTAMTDIIMKHQGVVDKYIGDAIMAFWGAPLEQLDHVEMACNTSLDMIGKLGELQKKWTAEKFPLIKIGIGLNSGDAVIGNMGSYERFDYTAMGDTINIGSRLEGLTKTYGVAIIVSEFTMKKVAKKFVFRKLDLVCVKGKKKPLIIYELVSRVNESNDIKKIKTYEKGFELYLQKKFSLAEKEFKKVNDYASKEFIKRCEMFKKKKPSKTWDGVWIMRSK